MVRNQVLLLSLLVVFINFVKANVVVPRACGGQLFVEGNVVIDVPTNKGCVWEIQTDNDHILAFTVIDGSFEQVQNFVSIHDGLQEDSPVLLLENQKTLEFSKKDLPPTVYSSKSVATIHLKEMTTSPLKLKIQRAVNCPFNLGSESSCGRAVDEISCYCATFTKRSQPDQKKYCTDNRMLLLSLESSEEENAVVWAWGASDRFWTSLSDEESEGTWIWQTTMQLPTGYTNWYPGQPDNGGVFYNEHCMTMNNPSGWGDTQCKDSWDAICESH